MPTIKVDDATRAAVEEGVVPGGGVMLLKASTLITVKGLNEDETAGHNHGGGGMGGMM